MFLFSKLCHVLEMFLTFEFGKKAEKTKWHRKQNGVQLFG